MVRYLQTLSDYWSGAFEENGTMRNFYGVGLLSLTIISSISCAPQTPDEENLEEYIYQDSNYFLDAEFESTENALQYNSTRTEQLALFNQRMKGKQYRTVDFLFRSERIAYQDHDTQEFTLTNERPYETMILLTEGKIALEKARITFEDGSTQTWKDAPPSIIPRLNPKCEPYKKKGYWRVKTKGCGYSPYIMNAFDASKAWREIRFSTRTTTYNGAGRVYVFGVSQ